MHQGERKDTPGRPLRIDGKCGCFGSLRPPKGIRRGIGKRCIAIKIKQEKQSQIVDWNYTITNQDISQTVWCSRTLRMPLWMGDDICKTSLSQTNCNIEIVVQSMHFKHEQTVPLRDRSLGWLTAKLVLNPPAFGAAHLCMAKHILACSYYYVRQCKTVPKADLILHWI